MDRDDYKKTGLDNVSDDELKNFFGSSPERDEEEDRKRIKKYRDLSITCFVCGLVGYFFAIIGCCLIPLDIAAAVLFIVAIVMGNRARGSSELKVLRILGLIYSYTGLFAVAAYALIYVILGVGALNIFN